MGDARGLLFSFSLPLTKVAVGGFNPFLTATGRAVIAGSLATVVLLVRRVPVPPRQYFRPLFFTMLGAVFGWAILLALALQRTTSAHAAVIAAFMPLTTAAIAVRRAQEHVSRQFWVAALTGTAALVLFGLSRGGASGGDPVADLLVVGAVLSSSWCYVEGAVVTRVFPGWQVISWVVVLALPVTVPASIVLWVTTSSDYDTTTAQWASLIMLGLSSIYLAFFAWYRDWPQPGSPARARPSGSAAADPDLVGTAARGGRDRGDGRGGTRGDRFGHLGPAQPPAPGRRPGGVRLPVECGAVPVLDPPPVVTLPVARARDDDRGSGRHLLRVGLKRRADTGHRRP